MTGFVDRFGGAALQPAQAAFRAVALSADVTLVWPPYATSNTDYVAGIMDVTPSTTGLSIEMPDATLVSTGTAVIYSNLGAAAFSVKNAAGGTIATPAAGEVRYLYLTDNTTAAGTWVSILFGVGASSPDASQLAGYGLKALASAIVFAPVTVTLNVDYQVLTTDRAKVFVWIGGSGTITLPTLADVTPDFEVGFRNEGTGTLTVTTGDGSQIDAGASIDLQVDESCYTHSGPTAWYTVGRGRNTQFNFTKLTKSVTGGTDTLTLTEAANVVQVYTGTLASSEIVVVPAVVQVYYIINDTAGAHTFKVKSPIIGGTTVSVDQGEAAILFCDGTNIINCTTSGAVAINATIPAGAVGAPSLKFAPDPTTGIYQPTTAQFALAISGVRRFLLTATGINGTAIGQTTPAAGAFSTLTANGVGAYPGLVCLQVGTASNSTDIELTAFSSTYDEYEVHFESVVPQTAAGFPLFIVNADAGNNYKYAFQTQSIVSTSQTGYAATAQGAVALNISATSTTAAHGGCSGVLKIYSANAAANKQFTFSNVAGTGSTGQDSIFGQGLWLSTAAITSIDFFMLKESDNSAQNIASGTFRLYGVRKAVT